jgi:uncharacterized Ntn-hydrolase superfamily protein
MRTPLIILVVAACTVPRAGPPAVATFSIIAYDPATDELGVAVQSRFLAVGSVVPWARAGVGAVATQSYANLRFGPDGLALLAQGKDAQQALDALIANDARPARRQLAIIDAQGNVAAYTGKGCHAWAGHKKGANYSVQGNILAGEAVVEAMAKAFTETKGELPERLVAALAGGQQAGGDRRGRQSAALLVVKKNAGYGGNNDRYIDLRVDDHKTPIAELGRLLRMHRALWRR